MTTVDFDAFLAEERAGRVAKPAPIDEPPTLRIGGVDYRLPAELPAIVGLHIVRQKRGASDDSRQAAPEALNAIGEALFGEDEFAEILIRNQLSIPDLGALITAAFGAYGSVVAPVPNPQAQEAKPTPTST